MGALWSVIDELLAEDPHAQPAPALAAGITDDRRAVNRLDGAYLAKLAVFDSAGGALGEWGSTQAWARATLRLSPARASRDVHLARDLQHLPATRAALQAGDISIDHAQVIAGLRGLIDDQVMVDVEPHLVDAATWKSPTELRRVTAHVRHRHSLDLLAGSEEDDFRARSLHASTTIGGMGVGNFTLHPAGMETFATALHALSAPAGNDDRSPAQRRADALITMAELALRAADLPITGGVRPHVTVQVSLPALRGEPGAPGADYSYGATTSAKWARRFACDASIARVVFGPDGSILDAGRATRTFTAAQVRAVVARDRHCIWPGCDAPPGWCDLHHIVHWAHGGTTSVDNAALLCGRHHDRVHVNGYAVVAGMTNRPQVHALPHTDPHWHGHPPHRRT